MLPLITSMRAWRLKTSIQGAIELYRLNQANKVTQDAVTTYTGISSESTTLTGTLRIKVETHATNRNDSPLRIFKPAPIR